ncbi:MAG: SIMPL domain-containing protein [Sulfuricaulis sp.]
MPWFVRLLVTTYSLVLAVAAPAEAADTAPRYNQIHFQVERSRLVDNDQMQAVLGITAEGEDPARLANQINHTMNWALKSAKARDGIEVSSGGYQSYPVYDQNKIRRWRSSQELLLQGSDFATLSGLIGQLQERLQVTSINFSVSPKRRAALEDELIEQALGAFKQRAELVRKQFAANGYRIVDVSISTDGGQLVPMRLSFAMATKSVASPALAAGTSTLTVSVIGIIELQ